MIKILFHITDILIWLHQVRVRATGSNKSRNHFPLHHHIWCIQRFKSIGQATLRFTIIQKLWSISSANTTHQTENKKKADSFKIDLTSIFLVLVVGLWKPNSTLKSVFNFIVTQAYPLSLSRKTNRRHWQVLSSHITTKWTSGILVKV